MTRHLNRYVLQIMRTRTFDDDTFEVFVFGSFLGRHNKAIDALYHTIDPHSLLTEHGKYTSGTQSRPGCVDAYCYLLMPNLIIVS